MKDKLSIFIGDNCHWHYHLIRDPDPEIENQMDLLPKGSDNFALKRKYEYIAGRICAQKSLENLGVNNFRIESGAKREPIWPKGIVGSISHTKNLAISVVSSELAAIGIDVEAVLSEERFESLKSQFLSENEVELIKNDPTLGTIIFSAKESLYKALYPIVETFFGFHDAEVIKFDNNSLHIKLLRQDNKFSLFNKPISIEYLKAEELIFTLIKIS